MTGPVNIPLLRKAVEWAEAEAAKPERQREWHQGEYVIPAAEIGRDCGTCYCIAGWICQAVDGVVPPRLTSKRAADLLGIDVCFHNGWTGLFDACNTIEDVRLFAEGIAAEAGERL